MSAIKVCVNDENELIHKLKRLLRDVNKVRSLSGEDEISLQDLICENIEEFVVINEYRMSKNNYLLSKLSHLKKMCKFNV